MKVRVHIWSHDHLLLFNGSRHSVCLSLRGVWPVLCSLGAAGTIQSYTKDSSLLLSAANKIERCNYCAC